MYETLFSIALFILIARNCSKFHPLIGAAVVVGGTTLLTLINHWINPNAPLPHIGSTTAQYIIEVGIFYGMRHYEDSSFSGFFFFAIIGWPVIYLLTPAFAERLF
jgi:hypothetical protein